MNELYNIENWDRDKLSELQNNTLSLAKFDGTEKIVNQLKNI